MKTQTTRKYWWERFIISRKIRPEFWLRKYGRRNYTKIVIKVLLNHNFNTTRVP